MRYRLWERQLPKVIALTDFDRRGVRFEATNTTELHRIIHGGYEPEFLSHMLAALAPDDVLYDIGANVGLVALHAARRCRTVAFEPDPGFLGCLRRNRDLNPAAPIDIQPVAISDKDSMVQLYTDGVNGTSASLMHQGGDKPTVEVEARAIDTLVESGALPPPTVLKVDIEGAEILALRGARRLLEGHAAPRLLFLEVHDSFLPGFGSSAEEVLALVHRAGYQNLLYEAKRADQRHVIIGRS